RCEVRLDVDLSSACLELFSLLAHPSFNRRLLIESLLRREIAHVLRDLHRAEMRAAHRAEMGLFRALLRQRLVVEFARGLGVEREAELRLHAEFEAGFRERAVD